jgi:DNA-nicking Smr family endonuclease
LAPYDGGRGHEGRRRKAAIATAKRRGGQALERYHAVGCAAAATARSAPAATRLAPQLEPFDRRLKQRLARGTAPIDARIDLHGKTQSAAYAQLLSFLRRAQAEGAKFVLVITGKGARDDGSERGVLKRQVPHWLELPEFRGYVVGFEHAHATHGGAGALYVRIRRQKSGRKFP